MMLLHVFQDLGKLICGVAFLLVFANGWYWRARLYREWEKARSSQRPTTLEWEPRKADQVWDMYFGADVEPLKHCQRRFWQASGLFILCVGAVGIAIAVSRP